jgi:hypothetical protein
VLHVECDDVLQRDVVVDALTRLLEAHTRATGRTYVCPCRVRCFYASRSPYCARRYLTNACAHAASTMHFAGASRVSRWLTRVRHTVRVCCMIVFMRCRAVWSCLHARALRTLTCDRAGEDADELTEADWRLLLAGARSETYQRAACVVHEVCVLLLCVHICVWCDLLLGITQGATSATIYQIVSGRVLLTTRADAAALGVCCLDDGDVFGEVCQRGALCVLRVHAHTVWYA